MSTAEMTQIWENWSFGLVPLGAQSSFLEKSDVTVLVNVFESSGGAVTGW